MMRILFFAFCFVPFASATASFEWAGIFETPNNVYKWGAEKVDGAYVDPGMQIVLLGASDDEEETLHNLEAAAETAFGAGCTNRVAGETLTPGGGCYQLQFDTTNHLSIYNIDASSASHIAFFAEHYPTEFERNSHYLKDVAGEDIEPHHELPEEEHSESAASTETEKPWGTAIGSSVLVNLCTLIGVIFMVPIIGTFAKNHMNAFHTATSGFAAGALLAAAFLLLLFEGTHLVASGYDSEADQTAVWGVCILAGFLIGSVIDFFALAGTYKKEQSEEKTNEEGTVEKPTIAKRMRILSGVLIGDFVHNICDGVFIASAFMGCGDSFGWGVAAASIYHEIAQEISDYFVLTSEDQGALHPAIALGLNFLSGTGVLLGALVILAQDEVDNLVTGVLLAIGGGVYIQIGASECMVKVHKYGNTPGVRALGLFMFFFGAALIGLVLFDHEHCVPEVAVGEEGGGGGGHH
jgi:zinc transporter ZupT